ncbi:PR domain zinc finger protein 12-like [Plectropomus leopardus]|uniref:PR domain zinc finger protein 12-like n=1 Tax=Plectropomus leopardus TaxID=160734 RepID=UPI001C4DAC51|nr:PR domain zinc finger protein 12-like [Plectropomus leopardus]
MSRVQRVQKFRIYVTERLHAALEDILSVFEKTVVKYEEEAALSQEVISRQHALLCALQSPMMEPPDAFTQQLLPPPQDQDRIQDPDPRCAEEQLQVLDEADIIQFTYSSCGSAGPGAPTQLSPDQEVNLVSSETEDSEDYGRDSPDNQHDQQRPKRVQGPALSCRVCSRPFRARRFLIRHLTVHLQDPELLCGLCGRRFHSTDTLRLHLQTHRSAQRTSREPETRSKEPETRTGTTETRSRERRVQQNLQPQSGGGGVEALQVKKKKRLQCDLQRRRSQQSAERSANTQKKRKKKKKSSDSV